MSWERKNYRYYGPSTAGAVFFGAVVGGIASAAGNARKVKSGEMTGRQAALDALREAGTTGLSAGAGVAAMCRLGMGGFAGLLGITVVAAGTKYLLDTVVADALTRGCAACAKAPGAEAAEPVTEPMAAAEAKPASKTVTKAAAKAPAKKKAATPKPPKPKVAKAPKAEPATD